MHDKVKLKMNKFCSAVLYCLPVVLKFRALQNGNYWAAIGRFLQAVFFGNILFNAKELVGMSEYISQKMVIMLSISVGVILQGGFAQVAFENLSLESEYKLLLFVQCRAQLYE